MSVKATVIFWRDGKAVFEQGPYEFVQLPSVGDQIVVRLLGGAESIDGTEDIFDVLKVEHIPATSGEEVPAARLLCEFVTGRCG
jgi:hypothetical protein